MAARRIRVMAGSAGAGAALGVIALVLAGCGAAGAPAGHGTPAQQSAPAGHGTPAGPGQAAAPAAHSRPGGGTRPGEATEGAGPAGVGRPRDDRVGGGHRRSARRVEPDAAGDPLEPARGRVLVDRDAALAGHAFEAPAEPGGVHEHVLIGSGPKSRVPDRGMDLGSDLVSIEEREGLAPASGLLGPRPQLRHLVRLIGQPDGPRRLQIAIDRLLTDDVDVIPDGRLFRSPEHSPS